MSTSDYLRRNVARAAANLDAIAIAEERRRRANAENTLRLGRVLLEQAADVLQATGQRPEALQLGAEIQQFIEDTAPRVDRRAG